MPSLPSSYFHLLRHQALGPVHRPLVVFTPKSMLRAKAAASKVEEFTQGTWQPVIDDASVDPAAVRSVLLCSGKVTYDVLAGREAAGRRDVAIVRLEQLYPVPGEELSAVLARYPHASDVAWVQEEPANMGAWPTLALALPELIGRPLRRVSRPASASPATGSHKIHEIEQAELIQRALAG
jgi:2-oxoglutarate dehydrogenase complex dehydrogenase (E1) component-like enzyme